MRVKGLFTFRFAAVCFGLSAVFELLSLQDEAVLLGHIVGGAAAVAYHVVYTVLFTVLAHGLWNARRVGYHALWVTSVIYTVDRLQMLFVGDTLATSIQQQVAEHPEVLQITSVEELLRILTATTLAFLVGWWAFVGYAYYRRDYFGIGRAKPSPATHGPNGPG